MLHNLPACDMKEAYGLHDHIQNLVAQNQHLTAEVTRIASKEEFFSAMDRLAIEAKTIAPVSSLICMVVKL